MEQLTEMVVTTLSQLTVIGDILLLVGVLGLVLASKNKIVRTAMQRTQQEGLWMAFVVALVATLGSLYFSEAAGFIPCKLCWFQRILMYPLPIMLLIAALRKDKGIFTYVLSLSFLGLIIALYHYYVQVTGTEILPCSTVGYSVSCTEDFFLRYGYITIPVMSATAFGLISLIGLINLLGNKKS